MKRYEKMEKQEILEFVLTNTECNECPIYTDTRHEKPCADCTFERAVYLMKDIQTKPRIATINTVEELEMAYEKFCKRVGFDYEARGFKKFLAEEIEVE